MRRGTGPTGAGVGRVRDYAEGLDTYVAHLVGVLPNRLDGLKIVLDEAHGAASQVSPEAFRRAGAEVVTIGAEPDGLNINDGCGSTHLAQLKAAVVAHGAALGIAHDGDADRCLAVDHTGRRSTATRFSPCWRSPCGSGRRCGPTRWSPP